MRFSPVVIKWSCKIANKCRKSGYEAVRSILPIPTWETTKQYRQSTSTTEPISQENLQLMIQELKRRRCKGIGGIHWDEMTIKEGIVLCKRTGELVGFDDDISSELNKNLEDLCNENNDCSEAESDQESCDNSDSSEVNSSIESEESDDEKYMSNIHTKKAKLICQFFSPL